MREPVRNILFPCVMLLLIASLVIGGGALAAHAAPSGTQAAIGSYPSAVLADHPYLYYRLDETSGPTVADSSGNNHPGAYVGGVTYGVPGALKTDSDPAITLDGSSGYLYGATRVSNPQVFTVEVWFKTTTTHGGKIVGFGSSQTGVSGSDDRHVYMTDSGQLVFGVYPNQTVTISSPGTYNDGAWHLLDASLGVDGLALYVDGQIVASDPYHTSTAAYSGYWRFGYDTLRGWPNAPSSFYFAGSLDEAAVYPAALTPAQIAAHYQAAGYSSGPAPVQTATISAAAQQTIAGFGAAGDWWSNDLHYFPDQVQQQVAEMLFTDKGLSLSQYRYNIGGGGVGVVKGTPDESELGPETRAPQTFYVAPNIYDWNHDPGGTTFLLYAGKYHVPEIVAHVNSAPPQFTTNGQSCGGQLSSSQIDAYAQYLATVVQHVHDVWHTTISYVTPMNEPDYTRSDCTQEGMVIPPNQRAAVVNAAYQVLHSQAPYAQVTADESSQVGSQFLPEESAWLPSAAPYLAAISTHTYDFPNNATLQAAGAVAKSYGKPYWASEICCVVGSPASPTFGQQYDPTITGALPTANIIWQDLTQANASAFDWWVALSAALGCDPATQSGCATTENNAGYNDGLIYYDPNFATDHDYSLYLTKRFWMLGNFSRFVRPGAVRHDVSGVPGNLRIVTFQSRGQWQAIVINDAPTGATDTTVKLQFPNGTQLQSAQAYRTSASEDLAAAGAPQMSGSNQVTVTVPAASITTYVFDAAPSGSGNQASTMATGQAANASRSLLSVALATRRRLVLPRA